MSEWVEWSREIVNKINNQQLSFMVRCKPELLTHSQRKACKNKTYNPLFIVTHYNYRASTMKIMFTGVIVYSYFSYSHIYPWWFNQRYLVRLLERRD